MSEPLHVRARRLAPAALRRVGRTLPDALALEGLRELLAGLAASRSAGLPETLRRLLGVVLRDADLATVHAVQAALRAVVDDDPRSVEYGLRCGRNLVAQARGAGVDVARGARVLELGPGWTLLTGVAFVAAGARWTGVDVARMASHEAAFYRDARAQVAAGALSLEDVGAQLTRFDAALDLRGDVARVDPELLRYLAPVDAARLPLDDASQDVVLSNAALEHVRDPAAVIAETARVLVPGGVAVHQVDLRDHRDFDRPRAHLADDDAAWAARFAGDPTNHAFVNRWRPADLTRAFAAAGFTIERADVTLRAPLAPGERDQLAPRFRDLPADELETLGLFFVVRTGSSPR